MIGTATRLLTGATRLMRPNVAAISGAVSSVAIVDATRLRRSVPRQPPATNAGELREEQHRDRDEPHVQAGYGEHVRQASRREAIAQRGRQLLHVCDEEGAYERRVVAEVRVDAPPDGRAPAREDARAA